MVKSKILATFCAGLLTVSTGIQAAERLATGTQQKQAQKTVIETSPWFDDKDLTLTGVYYYPEHWDESQWERDFKKMHELGFEFTHFAEFAGLAVNSGVAEPPKVNPYFHPRKRRRTMTAGEYVEGILKGDVTVLSRAVTLVESLVPEHQALAQEVIEKCLPSAGNSRRIGITGVPGAGKSTSIDEFGLHVLKDGGKLAVLAIDPSSERTKGSILGDKTRMEKLSIHPKAFIRPSPSAGSLGGVARKTRESIVLCEAAGFNNIFVETVGVGQSTIVYPPQPFSRFVGRSCPEDP
jgi:hypothetical protein